MFITNKRLALIGTLVVALLIIATLLISARFQIEYWMKDEDQRARENSNLLTIQLHSPEDFLRFFIPELNQEVKIPLEANAKELTVKSGTDTITVFLQDATSISKVGRINDERYWAVPFVLQSGGSGSFWYLALIRTVNDWGYPVQHLGSHFVGDRIKNLQIEDAIQAVKFSFDTHGPTDSLSDVPTVRKTYTLGINVGFGTAYEN